MGRDMARITVTLHENQRDLLNQLSGENGPFDSRSAVIRHLIEEYDPDKTVADEAGRTVDSDSPTEPTGSYTVTLDAHQLVRENAGALTRLKWRFGGIPPEAYTSALERWQTALEAGDVPDMIELEPAEVDEE